MKTHTAKANECLVSIALENNATVTELEEINQDLLKERELANCLLAGDKINLPDAQTSSPTLTVNEHNVIQVNTVSYQLPIQITDSDLSPIPDIQVKLAALNQSEPLIETTDTNGIVRFTLPLTYEKGLISYTVNQQQVIRPIYVGALLPPNSEVGMRQRINNAYPEAQLKLNRKDFLADTLFESIAQEQASNKNDIKEKIVGKFA